MTTPPASAEPNVRQPQVDAAMQQLRRVQRRPAFTVTAVLVGLYLSNAILANVAPGFMAISVIGSLNIGLFLVLLQSGTTVWAAWWYGRHARTSVDPLAKLIRSSIEHPEDNR